MDYQKYSSSICAFICPLRIRRQSFGQSRQNERLVDSGGKLHVLEGEVDQRVIIMLNPGTHPDDPVTFKLIQNSSDSSP
jgi:hypothetical protein